jgi:hypothetical protein
MLKVSDSRSVSGNLVKKVSVYLFTLVTLLTLIIPANAQKYRFFGNNISDWSVFTFPSAGGQIRWFLLRNDNPSPPTGAVIADIPFGRSETELVPNMGNYTGDARHDLIFYRDDTGSPANTYIVANADGSANYIPWGNAATDVVGAEGDYDGDGKMDYTVVRATSTTSPLQWWVLRSSDNTAMTFTYGSNATDIALPGADYTGDGKDDPTVARIAASGAITWIVGTTSAQTISWTTWGNFNTDFIIPGGDYDGDHKADFMVWRGFGSVNANWYLLTQAGVASQVQFGVAGASGVRDTALRAGDYDGDGKTDIAIYRPSTLTFFVLRSSGSVQTQQWGITGNTNIPIASFGTF